jgi:hypothetical protein
MTFEPQTIETTDLLSTGTSKINDNFEAVQDEFDGMDIGIIPDQFEMLYSPSNYTPDIAPSSTTDEQLASHLKGIDDALLALSERIAALE